MEAPGSTFKEIRPSSQFPIDVALMSSIIDFERTNFNEEKKHKVWKDAMMEQYHFIMENEVCDIVQRPKGK